MEEIDRIRKELRIAGMENMCEANAYLLKDGREELLLEAVDVLENREDGIRLANIFGEQKVVQGTIHSMSLVNHKILLESRQS